jgi:hypothetical protein
MGQTQQQQSQSHQQDHHFDQVPLEVLGNRDKEQHRSRSYFSNELLIAAANHQALP